MGLLGNSERAPFPQPAYAVSLLEASLGDPERHIKILWQLASGHVRFVVGNALVDKRLHKGPFLLGGL